MPRIGTSITKTVSFRGVQQPFSNTYYYDTANPLGDNAPFNALLDALIPFERAIHSNVVTYVKARLWSAGGTKAENQMLIERNLSGTGGVSGESTAMDRERAFLLQLRAGVDSKGRPVYLRKWLHLCVGVIGGSSITNGQLQNTASLVTAQRDAIVAFGNNIKSIDPGAGSFPFNLVSEKGRSITGSTTCHPWLEHHQLGDEWRDV